MYIILNFSLIIIKKKSYSSHFFQLQYNLHNMSVQQINKYKSVLVRMMSFLDGVTYSKETEFSNERLIALTPEDIMRYFYFETFGIANPTEEEKLRPKRRSSCIEFWKKSISSFMPNRLMHWDEMCRRGNPTRSIAINNFLKLLKRLEVKKLGVESKARRAMTDGEFRKIKLLCFKKLEDQNQNDKRYSAIIKYGVAAQMNFQFHMLARLDDTCNVPRENIQVHPNFEFALKTRLNWAKNCDEERDAPWQVILGSLDSNFCVLISLGMWLVIFFRDLPHAKHSPYVFGFSADCRFPEGGTSSKQIVRKLIAGAIKEMDNLTGLLGAHSIRKFGATRVRRCGATRDDRDIRGRWKRKRSVGDVYDDVELPWPDTKLATYLCIGGPCKYKIKTESGIDNNFILQYIMKDVLECYEREVCIVLGVALLFYMFTPEGKTIAPSFLLNSVHENYHRLHNKELDTNPVERIALMAHGCDGEVFLDEIIEERRDPQDPQPGNRVLRNDEAHSHITGMSEQSAADRLRGMQSQLSSLKASVLSLEEKMLANDAIVDRKLTSIQRGVQRLNDSPGRRIRASGTAVHVGRDDRLETDLSRLPKTLYELWDEYTVGLEGRKPAKLYTSTERGRCKYKYTRRKVVWSKVEELVLGGHTAHAAIDMILDHYGKEKSVTQVINLMRKDRLNKSYPQHLCI